MIPFSMIVTMIIMIGAGSTFAAQTDENPTVLFAAAAAQFDQGEFERAIATWRKVGNRTNAIDHALMIRAHLAIAAACQRIGLYQEAKLALTDAESLLRDRSNPELIAQFHLQAGNLSLSAHRNAEALESLSAASAQVALTERKDLRAMILNDYANALAASGYLTDATAAYTQARDLAIELRLPPVALAAAVNLARVQVQQSNSAASAAIAVAKNQWNAMQPSFEWAMAGLALVELRRQLGENDRPDEVETITRIESFAVQMQNLRLLAATNLALGVTQGESALRRAIFYASQAQAPDMLYEAHWRLAQLQRRQGQLDEAIESFELALRALNPIRDELMSGPRDSQRFFQSKIRPVYTDFVDALMSSSASAEPRKQAGQLERARNVIETLRGAELQDYFRDECVTTKQAQATPPAQPLNGVAILYPIVLAQRLELLLMINGQLHRHSVDATQEQVSEAALRLREFVQDGTNDRFKPYAMRLHRWLIDPVRTVLAAANVDTLVVVPDGVLRTVPFAVLHDGDRYLIENFAVAVTPALKLTELHAPQKSNRVLLAGIGQSVQGFAPLPEVTTELQSIRDRFGGRVLSDRNYTKANLQAALTEGDYSIVHMATHSAMSAASTDSFLLTYDGHLTLTDLEAALRSDENEARIDLLTLSACETAVGDERAALGLAGMAVKSGAASVVASLWKVDDAATAQLMGQFYEQLQKAGTAKARALRIAQLGMLANAQYAHPVHWSAFMLIGNWQ